MELESEEKTGRQVALDLGRETGDGSVEQLGDHSVNLFGERLPLDLFSMRVHRDASTRADRLMLGLESLEVGEVSPLDVESRLGLLDRHRRDRTSFELREVAHSGLVLLLQCVVAPLRRVALGLDLREALHHPGHVTQSIAEELRRGGDAATRAERPTALNHSGEHSLDLGQHRVRSRTRRLSEKVDHRLRVSGPRHEVTAHASDLLGR